MPKIIKDIVIRWTWDGDLEALKGFNISLCRKGETPLTSSLAFATVQDPTKRVFIFNTLTITTDIQYDAFIQAIYEGKDSSWISTGQSVSIADDGYNTLARKVLVDGAAKTAIWGDHIVGTPENLASLAGHEGILNTDIGVDGEGKLTGTGAVNVTVDNSLTSRAYSQDTMPAHPNLGDSWFCTLRNNSPEAGVLFIFKQIDNTQVWVPAVDNTITTINKGVVISGVMEVGTDTGHIKAGMSGNAGDYGEEDHEVRFWAGSDFMHRDSAPFKVTEDGTLTATGATISGKIIMGPGSSLTSETTEALRGPQGVSYDVQVESTNGDTFRPGQAMSTTLKVHVFKNGVDVTNSLADYQFNWRRVSFFPQPYPNDDATWNTLYSGKGYRSIEITTDTVASRATFHCDIISE